MEKRIKQLEMITTRLARRSKKTASALITPYPISNAVFGEEVRDSVLRYMFPCDGEITKGVIDIGKRPKQEVLVTLSLMGNEVGEAKVYIVDKKRLLVTPAMKVKTADKLTVTISYKNEKPEDNITEFWACFLWVPSVKEVEVKQHLIDALDNDLLEE